MKIPLFFICSKDRVQWTVMHHKILILTSCVLAAAALTLVLVQVKVNSKGSSPRNCLVLPERHRMRFIKVLICIAAVCIVQTPSNNFTPSTQTIPQSKHNCFQLFVKSSTTEQHDIWAASSEEDRWYHPPPPELLIAKLIDYRSLLICCLLSVSQWSWPYNFNCCVNQPCCCLPGISQLTPGTIFLLLRRVLALSNILSSTSWDFDENCQITIVAVQKRLVSSNLQQYSHRLSYV